MSEKFISNEEYMERWEHAAPEAVNVGLSPEELAKHQGTRAKETTPWEAYDDEIDLNDPALLEAIDEYSKRVSDAEASNETKETLARLREGALEQAKEYQWVSPEEYKNAGARIGRIMHSDVFISKLRAAGVKCWYRQHPQPRKITLLVQANPTEKPKVACWVAQGFMPELSVMKFDDHGVPLDEKYRGWRTCLLQLILHGVIKEAKAVEVFGKVPVTPEFHRYNMTLQRFRSSGSQLAN